MTPGALGKVYEVRTTDSFFNDLTRETMGWRRAARDERRRRAHRHRLPPHLPAAAPRRRRAGRGGRDARQPPPRRSSRARTRPRCWCASPTASVGAIVTSWAYEPPGSTEKFSVVGEGGTMWSDGKTLNVKPRGGEVDGRTVRRSRAAHHRPGGLDFIDCLREGRRPLNTEVDGIRVLKVILAAYASADQKRIMALSDLTA